MGIRALTNSVGSRHSDGAVNWNHVPGKPHRCEMTLGLGSGDTQMRSTIYYWDSQREKSFKEHPSFPEMFSGILSLQHLCCHYGFIRLFYKRKKKAPNECFYIY